MTKHADLLIVDLDDTLVRSDLMMESCLQLIRKKPYLIPALLYWLLLGKAYLKHQIATRQSIEPRSLVYRQQVLDLINTSKQKGQKIWLVTAASQIHAQAVADHLRCFDRVLASNKKNNLKGTQKLSAIQKEASGLTFSYIGDSSSDLAIWKQSEKIFAVQPGSILLQNIKAFGKPFEVLEKRKWSLKPYVKAIRPQQWVKNSLLFIPLVAAHKVFDATLVTLSLFAFASFSLAASSAYVLNDLLDVEADRQHFRKKKRPFASGEISVARGLLLSLFLLFTAFGIGALVGEDYLIILATYLLLTLSYSFYFKQKLLVDVIMLASLYTLRIFAGGQATHVHVSDWLLSFSLFFFFGLALLKRFSEVKLITVEKADAVKGRGYLRSDALPLAMIGIASGFVALLILALYFTSEAVAPLYPSPRKLWLLMPFLVYWLSRVWILAERGTIHDDPVVFAIKDSRSIMTGVGVVGVLIWATF